VVANPGSLWPLAQVYGLGRFRGFFLRSALAQTAMHMAIERGQSWALP
jgi:hypothetical protein